MFTFDPITHIQPIFVTWEINRRVSLLLTAQLHWSIWRCYWWMGEYCAMTLPKQIFPSQSWIWSNVLVSTSLAKFPIKWGPGNVISPSEGSQFSISIFNSRYNERMSWTIFVMMGFYIYHYHIKKVFTLIHSHIRALRSNAFWFEDRWHETLEIPAMISPTLVHMLFFHPFINRQHSKLLKASRHFHFITDNFQPLQSW